MYCSHGGENDMELRTDAYKMRAFRKHVCGDVKTAAMFIDARTVKEDVPWDEAGDYITKITPT